jgi:hypothetical protein
MRNKSKVSALLLVLLMVISGLSLLMIKPASSQSIPKPSVPEFSLSFIDASMDVPTTYTTDPFTGQTVTHQGYHIQKTNFVVLIENQPLVYQFNGSFFYNINVKGHFDLNWTQWYLNDEMPLANASSSQTSITLGVLNAGGLALDSGSRKMDIPSNGQVDFQIQAMIGGFFKAGFAHSEFSGESSDWSNSQTITIGETSISSPNPTSTSTQNPTQTPAVPEFPSSTIPLLFFIMAISSLLVNLKKHK